MKEVEISEHEPVPLYKHDSADLIMKIHTQKAWLEKVEDDEILSKKWEYDIDVLRKKGNYRDVNQQNSRVMYGRGRVRQHGSSGF